MGEYQDSAALAEYCAEGAEGVAYAVLTLAPPDTPRERQAAYAALDGYRDAAALALENQAIADALDYGLAALLMDEERWMEAEALYSGILEYQDSAVLRLICEMKVKDALYAQASLLAEQGDYEQALEVFLSLGKHLDSEVQAVLCQVAMQE